MKAQDVFDAIDQLKPNDFNRSEKRGWLKQLEQMILREIIIPHGGTVEDVELKDFDDETDLLAPPPYDNIYALWLEAQIDRQYSEIAKYNNSITAFNAAYQTFSNWYNRTHMMPGKAVKYW